MLNIQYTSSPMFVYPHIAQARGMCVREHFSRGHVYSAINVSCYTNETQLQCQTL